MYGTKLTASAIATTTIQHGRKCWNTGSPDTPRTAATTTTAATAATIASPERTSALRLRRDTSLQLPSPVQSERSDLPKLLLGRPSSYEIFTAASDDPGPERKPDPDRPGR